LSERGSSSFTVKQISSLEYLKSKLKFIKKIEVLKISSVYLVRI